MPQIGESATATSIAAGDEECVFCQASHQDEEGASPYNFQKTMSAFKKNGRDHIVSCGRSTHYPGEDKAPLVQWSRDISATGGYKGAAHHCVAVKTVSAHRISGELKNAGYDPDRGTNCIWLPYNRLQFIRARAYGRWAAMQKHSGGHTGDYFDEVERRIDRVADLVNRMFCARDNKVPKDRLLRYMEAEEQHIWNAVRRARDTAYRLHADAFLDPHLEWGSYPEEEGVSRADFLNEPPSDSQLRSDDDDEHIAEDDPE